MSICRKILICWIMCFFILVDFSCNSEDICDCEDNLFLLENSDGEIISIEYSIYESFFPSNRLRKIAVVNQLTDYTITTNFSALFELYNIDSSVYYDYLTNNSDAYILDLKEFDKDLNIVLFSSNAREYLFRNPEILNPWDCFYNCYPKSTGLTSFSRVGFSRDSLYALVGVSFRSPSKGSDIIYCLKKERDEWNIFWTNGNETALNK